MKIKDKNLVIHLIVVGFEPEAVERLDDGIVFHFSKRHTRQISHLIRQYRKARMMLEHIDQVIL